MRNGLDKLPREAAVLRLAKIFPGDNLRLCEPVEFIGGWASVNTVLRRAALSGHVEVEPSGDLPDHFADVLNREGDLVACVALDRRSFSRLKYHWMRTRYERAEEGAR